MPGNTYVVALAIDPTAPRTLYAGMEDAGLFKSTDGGGSWRQVNFPAGALLFDPAMPGTIYAAGMFRGVAKSTNAGDTWSFAGTGYFVRALALDPSAPRTLYAGTEGGGVFKSTDAGATFRTFNTGLTSLNVGALAIDRSTPRMLYAATDGGVFSIQQAAVCVGDCGGTAAVAVNDLVTLVNIALGTSRPSTCANGGLPLGGKVTVAVIVQAVNHALNGCIVPSPTPIQCDGTDPGGCR